MLLGVGAFRATGIEGAHELEQAECDSVCSTVRRRPGTAPVLRGTVLMMLASGFVGCSGEAGSAVTVPQTAPFADLWDQANRVELEEIPPHVIIDIETLRRFPDGRFVVPDRKASTVRVHDAQGKLINRIGRHGSGPGEFTAPSEAAVTAAGRIWVVDSGIPRVSQFDSSYRFVSSFTIEADAIGTIENLSPSRFLIGRGGRADGGTYVVADTLGNVIRALGKRNALVTEVPYWISAAAEKATVGAGRVYTMTSLVYPIEVYAEQGQHLFAFGSPPPSWVQASQPKLGEFGGRASFDRVTAWLESFTIIERIDVYRDSLVIVTHARFKPDAGSMWNREQYAFDIYTLDGEKLYEDVPVPGRILRADQYLYALVAEPPDPWTIGMYELKQPAETTR